MRDTGAQMESRIAHHIPGVSSSIMVQPLLDGRVPYGRLQPPLAIFPIDKMKSSHIENDYIDCPAVVSQQPAPSQKGARGPQDSLLVGGPHPQLLRCEPHDVTHPWISFSGRPSSISSCSSGSTSSDQRLLDHAPHSCAPDLSSGASRASRASCFQSKPLGPKTLALKAPAVPEAAGKHAPPCQQCGRCRCTDCTLPRTLPSCWVCNQECLCSAQSLVDCATCMCFVKGVLYHCADDGEDDEGSCAEQPCSCSGSHCCARWTFMGSLSLVLPCLLCYLPATGCAKLSQKCYDRASRPGCRCKHPPLCKGPGVEKKAGEKEKQAS